MFHHALRRLGIWLSKINAFFHLKRITHILWRLAWLEYVFTLFSGFLYGGEYNIVHACQFHSVHVCVATQGIWGNCIMYCPVHDSIHCIDPSVTICVLRSNWFGWIESSYLDMDALQAWSFTIWQKFNSYVTRWKRQGTPNLHSCNFNSYWDAIHDSLHGWTCFRV